MGTEIEQAPDNDNVPFRLMVKEGEAWLHSTAGGHQAINLGPIEPAREALIEFLMETDPE